MYEQPQAPSLEGLEIYRKKYKQKLIDAATQSRDKAVSHRTIPFKVGSAVLLEEKGKTNEYTIFASHNFTPTPGQYYGSNKRCAERNALDGALLSNSEGTILAITTVSKEKSTDGTNSEHDVLHPCSECRKLMRQLIMQGNLKENSVLTSVNDSEGPESIKVEEVTVGEILSRYDQEKEIERAA